MDASAALYLRLSRDDGTDGQSESIINQKAFLEKYAKDYGFSLFDVYTDDGYSGTNFDRPAFKRMLEDIEKGKIKVVITKDMSRLGRDYILTGHYIERYFPEHQVRYIAVNDGIDTDNMSGNDMSPFKAVINDFYARDISKKVRTALTTKKESGKFIGSIAPYGYKKDPMDKNHLLIDDETSIVVRRIFKLFLEGETLLGIANSLSTKHIATPSGQKNLKATQKRFSGVWNEIIIKRILTSETYIGNMVQNRTKKISYKVDKKVSVPQEEWIIVRDTHEAIISQEDFLNVQTILKTRSYNKEKRKGSPHLLSGLVFCEDCHAPMTFVNESAVRTYIVCKTWKKYAKLKLCTSHCIREDCVELAVKEQLRNMARQVLQLNELVTDEFIGNDKQGKKEMQFFISKLEIANKASLSLYKDKASGIITEKEYIELAKGLNEEKCQYEKSIEELSKSKDAVTDTEALKKTFTDFLNFEQVSRENLILLVKRVLIGNDKEITIEFNFENPM